MKINTCRGAPVPVTPQNSGDPGAKKSILGFAPVPWWGPSLGLRLKFIHLSGSIFSLGLPQYLVEKQKKSEPLIFFYSLCPMPGKKWPKSTFLGGCIANCLPCRVPRRLYHKGRGFGICLCCGGSLYLVLKKKNCWKRTHVPPVMLLPNKRKFR